MFLRMAEVVATRSTCDRLSVGAVVTDWEMTNVKSLGYNGAARGLPNGCRFPDAPGQCGCVMHAEINALIKAPYHEGDLVMFTTHNPCMACSNAILNSRVLKLHYRNEYRDMSGVYFLRSSGLYVEPLSGGVE
jgi:dCMP deaminase